MTFNKKTETKETNTPDYEENGNKAWVRLIKNGKNGLVAFVRVIYDGWFMNDIAIKLKNDDSGDAYFQCPSKKMVGTDGKELLDAEGKPRYQAYFGPASKEKRDEIENFLMKAVEKVWE